VGVSAFCGVFISARSGVYLMVGPGPAYDEMIIGDFIAARNPQGSKEADASKMF